MNQGNICTRWFEYTYSLFVSTKQAWQSPKVGGGGPFVAYGEHMHTAHGQLPSLSLSQPVFL